MAEERAQRSTAAHLVAQLVDRVQPAVPARRWVLSPRFEMRRLAAFRAEVATAMGRIFIEEIARMPLRARRAHGLRLQASRTTGRGVVINTYRRAGEPTFGSFRLDH